MTALSVTVESGLSRLVGITQRWKCRPWGLKAVRSVVDGVDLLARGVFHVWRNRRYLTAAKLLNMALVNIQFRLKTERVVGRPYKMKIEPTNICNTHCRLCPTGIGLEGRAKGKMALGDYQSLIDRLKWHLVAVDLSMWGDPLIVPEIYRMIRYAHDRGIWTYLSSNLHAFKPEKGQAQALVESGLDLLTCSLHGATQETFGLYQPGKNLNEVIEKIRSLINTRDRMGSKTPVVQLNFVVTRHNEHERVLFERLADELGCTAVFSAASLNVRFLDRDKRLQPLGLAADVLEQKTRRHVAEWLPSDSPYSLAPYRELLVTGQLNSERYNGRKIYDCFWPWRMCVVNWDGSVVTCCGSFEPRHDLGNVFTQSFSKIWNGPVYRAARRSFKKALPQDQSTNNPCAGCPGFLL